MENKACSKCGAEAVYKTGIKGTKRWEGYFCTDRVGCKNVDWVDNKPTPKPVAIPPRKEPNWDEIRARKEEGMEWLNAKNNAALILSALITKGEVTNTNWYVTYKEIAEAIFGFQSPDVPGV